MLCANKQETSSLNAASQSGRVITQYKQFPKTQKESSHMEPSPFVEDHTG
jgi:hypothetical protein